MRRLRTPARLAIWMAPLLLMLGGCHAYWLSNWTLSLPTPIPALATAQPELVSYPLATEERLSICLPAGEETYDLLTQAEELTGIPADYRLVRDTGYSTYLMMFMYPSGDLPDLLLIQEDMITLENLRYSEALMELTQLVCDGAPHYLQALQADEWAARMVNRGGLHAFYQLQTGSGVPQSGLVVRADWLEQVGLDVPTTYDECEQVLAAFRDQIGCEQPLGLYRGCNMPGDPLSAGFGIAAYTEGWKASQWGFQLQDGQVIYGPAQPAYLDFLCLMREWYREGYFTSDYVNWNREGAYDKLIRQQGTGIFWAEGDTLAVQERNLGVSLLPMPPLTHEPGAQTHLVQANSGSLTGTGLAIGAGSEQAELCVRWCDFWYSEAGQALLNAQPAPQLTLDQDTPGGHLLPGIYDQEAMRRMTTGTRREIWDAWGGHSDTRDRLPEDLYFSEADEKRMMQLADDLNRAVQIFSSQFMVEELDEDDWADYLAELNNAGLSVAISCLQQYLDGPGAS